MYHLLYLQFFGNQLKNHFVLYKKEGENMVVILPSEEEKEVKEEEKSIWEKILGKLKLRD